jgi:ATP-dependent helicase HrpB
VAIEEADVLSLFARRVETRHDADFDADTGSVMPLNSRRLGAIRLSSGPDPSPDRELLVRTLLEGVRAHGLDLLPWTGAALQFRARAAFARTLDGTIPPLDDKSLLQALDEWLAPLVEGKRRLGDVGGGCLLEAMHQFVGYAGKRLIDLLAPAQFESPAGSSHDIDYAAPGGPTVNVRAQALFGLAEHPTIASGRVPLTLSITSPAGRPIQTTKDLPGFWAGSWREVAREMRGRYPKHPWPDDPAAAHATLRTKRADARNQ